MARLTNFEEECMTRRITAAAVALIAAAVVIASVATAASGQSATPYKASLEAVNPAATTAGLADVVGKAQLVDGKNNKVSLHMRNLVADTVYLWHVHEGSCAATGAPVEGWTYRTQVGANGTLTSNASGNGNTRGTSETFNADPAKSYSVNVHVSTLTNGLAAGTIIACGDLTKSKKPHPSQAKGPKS
jgi:hypothetical protein